MIEYHYAIIIRADRRAMDYRNYTGKAGEIVDMVIERWERAKF